MDACLFLWDIIWLFNTGSRVLIERVDELL